MSQPKELPPHYYLDNFRFLVDWVASRYADIMGMEELDFIARFNQLTHNSQCLLVRLASRKGPWFRSDKLRYAEIENLDQAATELIQHGLLSKDQLFSLHEAAVLLTKAEILAIFAEPLRPFKSQRKEILIELLAEDYSEPRQWEDWTGHEFGEVYQLNIQSIIDRMLLLFFGNAYQDLTEFVLQDLGLFRYETYNINSQHRLFQSREELLQYQQLHLLRELLAEADHVQRLLDLAQQLPPAFSNTRMERRRAKLVNLLAYELERAEEMTAALQLYQQTEQPPARERKIRLLEKMGEHEQAWSFLQELLKNPINEEELQIAERMAPRLAKKNGVVLPKAKRFSPPEHTLQLERLRDQNGDFLSVEEIARLHFHTSESPCFYAENALLNGLFGLWLWPEMFRSVEGAFANPFQMAPLDLYQEDFQKNRPAIAELWNLFDEDNHHQHIQNSWQKKQGIANHFVNWQFMDEAVMNMALEVIPGQHLKLIFQRLLFDLKANRSGLPDLIQFFPATKTYRMIEIKGPGDRVQDNQARWLAFFAQHHIPAEVCYVSWR